MKQSAAFSAAEARVKALEKKLSKYNKIKGGYETERGILCC